MALWFGKWGEEKADEYCRNFFERFEEIADKPFLFPPVDHIRKGYRRGKCGVDDIYFHVNDDMVEIMAIIGRQDVEQWI